MKKILISLALITFFAGCQNGSIQTYSSDQYTLQYPKSYSIQEPTQSDPVLTLKGDKGRVEIFNKNDFDIERIHGYSSSGEEIYESEYVPKEKLNKDDFTIWLFYQQDDKQTRNECTNIYKSLKINL